MKFKQFRKKLDESRLSNEIFPAAMLVLRRRGVRIFPDGSKVALYTNDKYNLTFTVPYGATERVSPIVGVHNE